MQCLRRIALCCCVLLYWYGALQAVAAPSDISARALATAATQRRALEKLRSEVDPAIKGVLQALKEGALYQWKDALYIFTEKGVFVDLNGKPLLDSAGEPLFPEDGMEVVELEEANIPLVQRILDSIALFAPEAATRRATALRLGNLRDVDVLPILTSAHAKETDADVRIVLTEALSKLRLLSPDPAIRLQAVEYFGAARAEASRSRTSPTGPVSYQY